MVIESMYLNNYSIKMKKLGDLLFRNAKSVQAGLNQSQAATQAPKVPNPVEHHHHDHSHNHHQPKITHPIH
jgi:hypothetical protein